MKAAGYFIGNGDGMVLVIVTEAVQVRFKGVLRSRDGKLRRLFDFQAVGQAFEDDPFGQFRLQHLFCKAIQYRHVSPLVFVEEVRVDSFDGFIDDVFRNEAGNADFRSGNDFDIDAVVTEDAEHAGSDARMAGHASTDDGNF